MNLKYRLFQRNTGIYFCEDRQTGKQHSLRTKDKTEATRLLNARNEAHLLPAGISLQIARAHLNAVDPAFSKRTWQHALEALIKTKQGENRQRWQTFSNGPSLNALRNVVIAETRADQFLAVLTTCNVSTKKFLRILHNFALDYQWLLLPVIPNHQWPKPRYKDKRAITQTEHEKIIERESNLERRSFYQLLWELGGSQGDIAKLTAEDVDWPNRIIAYFRAKSGQPAQICFDDEVAAILKNLPSTGPLFPYLRSVRASDRATEFKQRCAGLGIQGVTLHSYRYSLAERLKQANVPERVAQAMLGHASKAVTRHYAKGANPVLFTVGEWKKRQQANVIPVQFNKKPAGEKPAGANESEQKMITV